MLTPKTCVVLFSLAIVSSLFSGCSKSGTPSPLPEPEPEPEAPSKSWFVSTVAGNGVKGRLDGPAEGASFYFLSEIALDTAGNIYVSDDKRIRKISQGNVSSFAGSGISVTNMIFSHVKGLAVNQEGHVFNTESNFIRKNESAQTNSIIAGTLTSHYQDGTGENAGFYNIFHIAMDKNHTIYVPDYDHSNNQIIRKVTQNGEVTTLSLNDQTGITMGNGSNSFFLPLIAVDPSGNIYYTSAKNGLIKKRNPSGVVTVFAGSTEYGFEDGKGSAARFHQIAGMTCDNDGNLYITEYVSLRIRKITPDGTVTTIAGTQGPGHVDGHADSARFNKPTGIAADKSGALYIVDAGNYRIRKMEYRDQ